MVKKKTSFNPEKGNRFLKALHQRLLQRLPAELRPELTLSALRSDFAQAGGHRSYEAMMAAGEAALELMPPKPVAPETPGAPAPPLTAWQFACCRGYLLGEWDDVKTLDDVPADGHTGDGLLHYVLTALSPAEDCDSLEEAMRRLAELHDDLDAMLKRIEELPDSPTPQGAAGLNLYRCPDDGAVWSGTGNANHAVPCPECGGATAPLRHFAAHLAPTVCIALTTEAAKIILQRFVLTEDGLRAMAEEYPTGRPESDDPIERAHFAGPEGEALADCRGDLWRDLEDAGRVETAAWMAFTGALEFKALTQMGQNRCGDCLAYLDQPGAVERWIEGGAGGFQTRRGHFDADGSFLCDRQGRDEDDQAAGRLSHKCANCDSELFALPR